MEPTQLARMLYLFFTNQPMIVTKLYNVRHIRPCVEMVYNIMLPLMNLTFILINILLYVLILVISICFLVFTNSDIAHLFLSLDFIWGL